MLTNVMMPALIGHTPLEAVLSLVVALILGGAIGFEREWNGKSAGVRTNMIICLGSAAFTMIAQGFVGDAAGATRIIQGVITGVGFLGAGVLIQSGSGVHGLTTAASVWLVTSIGIACGVGEYFFAAAVTGLALITLFGLLPLTRWIRDKRPVNNGNGNGNGSAHHDSGQ